MQKMQPKNLTELRWYKKVEILLTNLDFLLKSLGFLYIICHKETSDITSKKRVVRLTNLPLFLPLLI